MWLTSARTKRIGRYQIDREIDTAGGFPVYLAFDRESGVSATLEVLPLAGDDKAEIKQAREAAELKVQQAARLCHERIAQVYDAIQHRGQLWVAHEIVSGETLENLLCTEAAISKDLISHVLYHTAACLNYAHQLGVAHGALSPGELVFQDDGSLKIVGFWKPSLASRGQVSAFDLTHYCSPEQIRGLPAEPASDQYSLAAIAYELLTGVTPFRGDSIAVRNRIVLDAPADPSTFNESLGEDASAVLMRALGKDPAARFESCVEFVQSLDDSLETPPHWVLPKEYRGREPVGASEAPVAQLEGEVTESLLREVLAERPAEDDARYDLFQRFKPAAVAAVAVIAAVAALIWAVFLTGGSTAAELTVAALSPPPAVMNQPYSFALQASGGRSPYEWSVVEGQLPDGLTLDSEGVISGQSDASGVYEVQVQVTESGSSATATQQLSLTVKQGPHIKAAATLTPAVVGREYSNPLGVAGGQRPYRWAIADGSLPPGMSLNSFSGFLDGRPDVAGTFRFSISVSDLFGTTSTRPFELTVRPAPGAESVETIVQAGIGGAPSRGGASLEVAEEATQ